MKRQAGEMDSLYQLAFVATRHRDAAAAPPKDLLSHLLTQTIRFEALGLTGISLHKGQRVLLCVEGMEEAVVDQYERLKADPDIQGVAILRQRAVSMRSFSRWSFVFDEDPRYEPESLIDRLVALVANAPGEIRQTFLAFAKLGPDARQD